MIKSPLTSWGLLLPPPLPAQTVCNCPSTYYFFLILLERFTINPQPIFFSYTPRMVCDRRSTHFFYIARMVYD